MVTAVILFVVTFMSFDYGIFGIVISPFYDVQLDGKHVLVELEVNTKTYRQGAKQLSKDLTTLYRSLPYDGYIKSRKTTGFAASKLNTDSTFYISNKGNHTFSHLSFSANPSTIEFNNVSKHDYISNDLDDEKAAIHILPFNKFRKKVRDDLAKDRIIYKPLHDFDLGEFTYDNSTFISMYFLVAKKDEVQFKDTIKERFILPNFDCDVDALNDDVIFCDMSFSSVDHPRVFEGSTVFNLFDNFLQYQKVLIVLSGFFLFISLLYLSFKESKEISIRRLYGNRETFIYLRIFMKFYAISMIVFIVTLMSCAALFLDFSLSITTKYLFVLMSIVGYYLFGTVLSALIFYGLLKCASTVNALKKPMNPILSLYLMFGLKLLAIFTLMSPLLTAFDKMNRAKLFTNHIHSYPHLKEGYVVFAVNYGLHGKTFNSAKNREIGLTDQASADNWLFEKVEKYGGSFISSYSTFAFFRPELNRNNMPFIAVNRNALKHEGIFDLENKRINVESLTKNTLLVPKNYLQDYKKSDYFGDADVYFVKQTPSIAQLADSIEPIVSPSILIVVDNPSNYVIWINQESIRFDDNQNVIEAFHKEVSDYISAPVLNKNQNFYDFALSNYQDGRIEFTVLTATSSVLLVMFSMVMILAFIESRRMHLAIQYIQGIGRYRRYESFIYLVYVSALVISTAVFIANFFSIPPLKTQSISGVSVILFVIETLLLVISIRRFEKQSTSDVLKGNS